MEAWVLVLGVAWVAVALLVAVVVGRGIRLADRRARTLTTADLPEGFTAVPVAGRR
jgi:hypothetical protein